jgi:hypothetical protein
VVAAALATEELVVHFCSRVGGVDLDNALLEPFPTARIPWHGSPPCTDEADACSSGDALVACGALPALPRGDGAAVESHYVEQVAAASTTRAAHQESRQAAVALSQHHVLLA